jgi:fructokinase
VGLSGAPVGVGHPGSHNPRTGLIRNANSTDLNGRPLNADLNTALGRTVRCANDANCFALSEAVDGAGAGAASVFGVILGTGVGGGLVIDGKSCTRAMTAMRANGAIWGCPGRAPDEVPGPPANAASPAVWRPGVQARRWPPTTRG